MFKLVLLFLTAKTKYYYDPRIHNFGNIGLGGQLHSKLAPYATKLIDDKCYNSINIRQAILSNYYQEFYKNNERLPKIIDLCCGTGTSTAANQIGIDTSEPMLSEARATLSEARATLSTARATLSTARATLSTARATLSQAQKNNKNNKHTKFLKGNAENYGQPKEFDTATLMFAFHEMPNYAHHKIIKNAKRITKHDIIIVDISPNYSPSPLMLLGEPYLLNYKATIQQLLADHKFNYVEYIPNHVGLWTYSHNQQNQSHLIGNLKP